jgi:hypothetical protein
VDLVDPPVLRQVGSLLRSTIRHGQEPARDRLGERLLDERPEIGVHRMHLEQADRALVEQLGDHIHRGYRSDVPGTEHQHGAAIMFADPVERGSAGIQRVFGDSG